MSIGEDKVVVEGTDWILDRLGRHILYCVDEGREVSRKYAPDDVELVRDQLFDGGLIEHYENSNDWRLTAEGVGVVKVLRERHDG